MSYRTCYFQSSGCSFDDRTGLERTGSQGSYGLQAHSAKSKIPTKLDDMCVVINPIGERSHPPHSKDTSTAFQYGGSGTMKGKMADIGRGDEREGKTTALFRPHTG